MNHRGMATSPHHPRRAPLAAARGAGLALACILLVACGDDGAATGDAGASDAGARRDSGRPPPLPTPGEVLPPDRYDCTAAGPFEPPDRPHGAGCLFDDACDARLVAAHRMGTPFAPENSLAALRASILLGVDAVETDIRLTADSEVVLMHDSDIDRTVEGTGRVDELTAEALRALPLVVDPRGPDGDFSCERVPVLDEVFALARGRIVVELEVKDTDAGVAAAEYLRDEDLYADAFLLCDPGECEAARTAVPDVPIMTRPHDATEVPAATDWDPTPVLVHIDAEEGFLTDGVVSQIHGAGAKVYANGFILADAPALALDDPSGYLTLFEDGVEVLQVEYPHFALHALGRL